MPALVHPTYRPESEFTLGISAGERVFILRPLPRADGAVAQPRSGVKIVAQGVSPGSRWARRPSPERAAYQRYVAPSGLVL